MFSVESEIKPEFVPSPLSFALGEREVGALVNFKKDYVLDTSFPLELQLASLTGYLITLVESDPNFEPSIWHKHSKEFRKLRDAIVSSGYVYMDSPHSKLTGYLMPESFNGTSLELCSFLDGSAADEFRSYFEQWWFNELVIVSAAELINNLWASADNKTQALSKKQTEELAEQEKNSAIEREISDLERQLTALEGTMGVLGLSDELSLILFRHLFVTPEVPTEKDFFRRVLKDEFESISGKPYDSDQVTNKYLHKDLVDALDRLVKNEKDALTEIGMWPLKLASAARTPLQQSSIKNPVAAGMFSSGHIFGVAFDLAVGPDFSTDKREKLNDILNQYGLVLPDYLSTKDPNHGFLQAYENNNKNNEFANGLILRMLSKYYDAMKNERDRQLMMRDNLNADKSRVDKAIAKLDNMIKAANERIENIQKRRNDLNTKKAESAKKLEAKKNEIAIKNAMKEQEREKGREWWGEGRHERPDKDGYWERFQHEEFHRADGCSGWRDSYENSRGEGWSHSETSAECRAGGDVGMHEIP